MFFPQGQEHLDIQVTGIYQLRQFVTQRRHEFKGGVKKELFELVQDKHDSPIVIFQHEADQLGQAAALPFLVRERQGGHFGQMLP